uniref:CO dehydrogenase flavoprotein C-terminal domain-containing protein n=1 Tax=Acrobeloides nanus TaxID=290746 RepID=A0A914ELE8_9BILA
MASGASIELASLEREKRLVKLDENFFIGYRKTILQPDEVILGIWIPYTASNEFFQAYKQAQRRDDDITIVTSAFLLQLDKNTRKVEKLKISFGGMASSTKMAAKSTQGLEGYIWDENLIEEISTCLIKEFELESDSPGGRPKYRQALCISFLFKFYLYVCEKIEHAVHNHINGMNGCEKDVDKFSSTQIYYVMYYAQPLAAIVAKDHETARRAANLVKVTITPEVPIVTIEVKFSF